MRQMSDGQHPGRGQGASGVLLKDKELQMLPDVEWHRCSLWAVYTDILTTIVNEVEVKIGSYVASTTLTPHVKVTTPGLSEEPGIYFTPLVMSTRDVKTMKQLLN